MLSTAAERLKEAVTWGFTDNEAELSSLSFHAATIVVRRFLAKAL